MKNVVCCLTLLFHLNPLLTQAIAPTQNGNTALVGTRTISIPSHTLLSLFPRAEASGGACKKECRKKCPKKRIHDPNDCSRCILCPPGMKPAISQEICIKDDGSDDDDPEKKRRGNCPDGKVLDPREGPQKPDTPAQDLKCAIDDEKDCKPPKIPETRPDGKENDANFKPKCLDKDDNDKTKCDDKAQLTEVSAGPDGKAKKRCRPTRQYENKKKSRIDKMKEQFKKLWEERKPDREKKNQDRKDRQQKIDDAKKEKEKKAENDKKKRVKSYKCGMATVMGTGASAVGLKRRSLLNMKRENKDFESYMELVACYFDQDFVESDEFLEFWPSDVNVDDIGPDIDEEAYMKEFNDRMERADFDFWNSHDFCRRSVNDTITKRCPPKRRDASIAKELEYEAKRKRAEKLLKRDILHDRDGNLDGEAFCDMGKRKRDVDTTESIEKRNPFLIFVEIAASVARMAGSLLSRTIPQIARFSPRLGELMKNGGRNLFRLAPKNTGQAGSRQAMKDAFSKIANHPAFKKCLRDGKP